MGRMNGAAFGTGPTPDSSAVVSRSLKGAGVNWGRLMKQVMMGRRKGKEIDDW